MSSTPNTDTPGLEQASNRPDFRTLGALTLFFVMLGAWLTYDLYQSRERLVADLSYRAMQRSQIVAQSFRTEVLATDYVLRDVLGRIQHSDLAYPDPDQAHADRIRELLRDKAETVPDFFSMVLFNKDCVFLSTATGNNIGIRSKPELCDARRRHQGPGPLVTYVPGAESASGQSVLVLSRNLPSPPGEFIGGVMSVIELERAQSRFESFDLAATDAVAMLDSAQVLLARRPSLPNAFEKKAELPVTPVELVSSASGASSGVQRDIDGRERIFGFSKVEGFPFLVAYGYDKEAATAEWRSRAWQLGFGYITMLLLAFLAARSHWVIQRQRNELAISRAAIHDLAIRDPLTGLYNRRFLGETLSREFARVEREQQPLAIVLMDIDFFKKVNDQYGHTAGDEVLKVLANLIRNEARESDLICRYGGEEFLAVMPNMSARQALERAESWRKHLEAMPIQWADKIIQITLSAGVAAYPDHGKDPEKLIGLADQMLYRSKNAGRNCVSVFDEAS